MAYLTLADLTTHLHLEVITEIVRDYKTSFANLAAFPATGVTGRYYIATDSGLYYKWNSDAYVQVTYIDLVARAINEGIGEAKSYLNRYDLAAIFGTEDDAPTYLDEHLNGLVKDIVCWKLIKMSNPNINIELFRTAYEDAVNYFKAVMKGNVDPAWPLRLDDEDTDFDESGHIFSFSNIKRKNHY